MGVCRRETIFFELINMAESFALVADDMTN